MSETETRTEAATAAYHRHDISDRTWGNHRTTPARQPRQSGTPRTRQPPLYQLRVLDPPHWRPLARPAPPTTDTDTTHRHFTRWQEDGHWARLLTQVSDDPDLEWLMIDASHIKMHQHGTGAVGGNQYIGRTKGG